MITDNLKFPYGLCRCGCGQKTKIATKTITRLGHKKGQPQYYLKGHAVENPAPFPEEPNPSGLCQCGCGQLAPIARQTHRVRGHIKGKPKKFINGHQTRPDKPQYIVDKTTGCWNWNWSKNKLGYGNLTRDGKARKAYQVYYELEYGPVPPGKELDHLCRNPSCVNPEHLEAVTHATNMRRGASTKLTEADVRSIRDLHLQGISYSKLSKQFAVTKGMIGHIVRGVAWKSI